MIQTRRKGVAVEWTGDVAPVEAILPGHVKVVVQRDRLRLVANGDYSLSFAYRGEYVLVERETVSVLTKTQLAEQFEVLP